MWKSILSPTVLIAAFLAAAPLAQAQTQSLQAQQVDPNAPAVETAPSGGEATGSQALRRVPQLDQLGEGTVLAPTEPTVSELTVNECRNLGCSIREDTSCPGIVHDYHTRNWACQCSGGSSCINQNSPY